MPEARDVTLTLYETETSPDNKHLINVFESVQKKYMGKISFDRNSEGSTSKIQLEYNEIEGSGAGDFTLETRHPKNIEFGETVTTEDIISTIQAKTGISPKQKNLEKEPDNTADSQDSEDLNNTIENLREEAGLNDSPEPDFE